MPTQQKSKDSETGRVTVEFVVANNRDVVTAQPGDAIPGSVPHVTMSGIVDTGAAKLVLPASLRDRLNLEVTGETVVRFADNRRESRQAVGNVWVRLLGRVGVFSAVLLPERDDALVGAMVLEELDLLVDCTTQSLQPRDPDHILTEIE